METLKIEITADADGEMSVSFTGRQPTGKELEQLMYQLAVKRSASQPAVDRVGPLQRREAPPAVDNPHITVNYEWTGAMVLGIRHAAYGWLYLRLTQDLQKNLFGDICRRLEAASRHPPGG